MSQYGDDIYTEPENVDVDTLANLGPLTALAGRFTGTRGLDVNPKPEGPRKQAFIETIDLQPIDPQANGPQLYYGLRYHAHIVKPNEVETYHDQVGYWLWEPATGTVIQTLTIPRGQTALAIGKSSKDAKSFELVARRGELINGICSGPFIEEAFRTLEYRIKVTIGEAGNWSYDEDTVMEVRGLKEPFHHTDRNVLSRVASPVPNPLQRAKLIGAE